jgi:superfamily II DNA or RNA helicase
VASSPEPHAIQRQALDALRRTRELGNEAGLVVLATGLGKTWLSAFDSSAPEFRRILFVAHREEILGQAMRTFSSIRPDSRLGQYTGTEKTTDAEILFASIQTLGRKRHLDQFAADAFDYIVVDEFHHAHAQTYRRLIDCFEPKFLLGLTATPDRMDGADVLALCQENLVFRCDVWDGIRAELLCPFKYFGVPDEVDYQNIPWRNARFDPDELTKAVATQSRAANALEQYRRLAGTRTLGFCCSQRHAEFMADYFRNAGVRARAVHSGESSAPRAESLTALESGNLDVLFTVDIFNEGVDLPNVDTVLMLRPTESSVIWTQQFGRGLRLAVGKPQLTVIDYIGNHRTFLVKARTLLQPVSEIGPSDRELAGALSRLWEKKVELPPGCEVTYELETVNILKALLSRRFRQAQGDSPKDEDGNILPGALFPMSNEDVQIFYEDFRERQGTRPTASEMFHAGYNPRLLRKSHGSWFRFVGGMGDLSESQRQAFDQAGEFLDLLERTQMSRSFKMLTLMAMLQEGDLPGEISIGDLTAKFQHLAQRSAVLRRDVGDSVNDQSRLQKLIEINPIEAWVGGRGMAGRSFFAFDGFAFRTTFELAAELGEDFRDLVRELVDWRLAEYLQRSSVKVSDLNDSHGSEREP